MKQPRCSAKVSLVVLLLLAGPNCFAAQAVSSDMSEKEKACLALVDARNLTILSARLMSVAGDPFSILLRPWTDPSGDPLSRAVSACRRTGMAGFSYWGDGGTDGDLDFADTRLAQGYAVANSNTGHDNGTEPGASFGFNNRQAEIDFGYRAVHLTVQAAKILLKAYFGKEPKRSYFDGCSSGGTPGPDGGPALSPTISTASSQGMRRFSSRPRDAGNIWIMQRLFRERFAGNLAFDTNGDGSFDSLKKVDILREAVLAKCDAKDGIRDGVIQDPLQCNFDPKSGPGEQDVSRKRQRGSLLHHRSSADHSGHLRRRAGQQRRIDPQRKGAGVGVRVAG